MPKKGFKKLIATIRANWKIAAVVIILTSVSGYILSSYIMTRHYVTSIDVYIESEDGESPEGKAATAALLFSSPKMYNAINDGLSTKFSYAQLQKIITIEHYSESQMIRAEFDCENSDDSYRIADMCMRLMQPVLDNYGANAKVVVVSPPVEPSRPTFPDDGLFTAMGAAVGLLLSLIGIIVIWRLDDTVSPHDDLKELYGVDVLGSLMDFDNEIDYLGR